MDIISQIHATHFLIVASRTEYVSPWIWHLTPKSTAPLAETYKTCIPKLNKNQPNVPKSFGFVKKKFNFHFYSIKIGLPIFFQRFESFAVSFNIQIILSTPACIQIIRSGFCSVVCSGFYLIDEHPLRSWAICPPCTLIPIKICPASQTGIATESKQEPLTPSPTSIQTETLDSCPFK